MDTSARTVQPFVDWYGIWAGYGGIDDETGLSRIYEAPEGVRLSVQPARKVGPFFRPERPWEKRSINHSATMVLDNGTYKMWHHCVGEPSSDGAAEFICYAESSDGHNWVRPDLGLYDYCGSRQNNILFPRDHLFLESVFIDPTAPAAERFKAVSATLMYLHNGVPVPNMNKRKLQELLRETANLGDVGTPEEIMRREWVMEQHIRGAVSADGLSWRILDKPLLGWHKDQSAYDSISVGAFDADTGEYVAYLRGIVDRRRSVRRTGGPKFGDWPKPRFVFMGDVEDGPTTTVYQPCYTRMPGSGMRVLFPSMYYQLDEELDIHLATSRDGHTWSRPERAPIITRDRNDGGRYSCLYAFPNLMPFNDEEWCLPFVAYNQRHDYRGAKARPVHGSAFAHPDEGEYWWAVWKQNRLVALEAPVEGRVTMAERELSGQELRLNFQTERDGWVKVELVSVPTTPPSDCQAFEGFGLAEADVLTGDHLSHPVTWRGSSDVSRLRGEKLSFRLTMSRAKVFAIEF